MRMCHHTVWLDFRWLSSLGEVWERLGFPRLSGPLSICMIEQFMEEMWSPGWAERPLITRRLFSSHNPHRENCHPLSRTALFLIGMWPRQYYIPCPPLQETERNWTTPWKYRSFWTLRAFLLSLKAWKRTPLLLYLQLPASEGLKNPLMHQGAFWRSRTSISGFRSGSVDDGSM